MLLEQLLNGNSLNIKILVSFTLSFLSIHLFSQTEMFDYKEKYSLNQRVLDYTSNYEISILDKRVYNVDKINLKSFNSNLLQLLKLNKIESKKSEIGHIKNKKILIHVKFFNLTESSSKKIIVKTISDIFLDGRDYSNLNKEFRVGDEIFTNIKIKNLENIKYESDLNILIENFSIKYAQKIVNKILEESKQEKNHIFEIVSIGTAKIKDNNKEEAEKKAILDALINGSELAFGIKIINKSEIIDYGDVTDIVKSEIGGNVLHYSIEKNSLVFTDDGYCCLVLKALIKKN